MPSTDLLHQLRSEWSTLGRTTVARRALTSLRTTHPDEVPPWVHDLTGLVEALEPRGGLDQLQRARLVAALLVRAEDPVLRRCLLQTLLPGIVSVARKLRFGDGIADGPRTFLADAVADAVELLEDWAGQQRLYAAPDLLGALRCRLRRRMLADKSRRYELTGAVEQHVGIDDDSVVEALSRELALAANSGVTDVDLLYARCVLGHSSAELASAVGLTGGILRRRLAVAAKPFVSTSS